MEAGSWKYLVCHVFKIAAMQVAARVGNALHFYYREEENSSHQIRLLQHGEHLLTVLQAS